MNPQMNQPNPSASSANAPVKRKRGRPRKDETQGQSIDKSNAPPLRPMVTRTQGEVATAPKPTTPIAPIASKGKDHIEVGVVDQGAANANDDDHNNNDEMVGQVVTGVLECAFDAGYFVTVRVGDSDVHMRGVVFKEACVVPVTPENDIAPNAKMHKRREIPIPVKLTPQASQQPAGNSSSKPTENIEEHHQLLQQQPQPQEQQQQQIPLESAPPKAVQNVIVLQGQSSVVASEGQTAQNPLIVSDSSGQNVKAPPEEPQFELGLTSFDQIAQNTLLNEPSIVDGVEREKIAQIVQNTLPNEPSIIDGVEKEKIAQESSEPVQMCDQVIVREENPSQVINEPHRESKEKREGDSLTNASLEESLSEPQLKMQKMSEHDETDSYLNANQSCEIVGTSETAVIKTTTDEIAADVLPMEVLIQPETTFADKEPCVVPQVVEPEIGGASGFQISMENTDNDEPLSENPSPMEAEYKEESEK